MQYLDKDTVQGLYRAVSIHSLTLQTFSCLLKITYSCGGIVPANELPLGLGSASAF